MEPLAPEASALVDAAMAAFTRQDFNTARQQAEQLVSRWPQQANGHEILGLVALKQTDFAAAREHLARADAALPNNARTINALAMAHRRLGDLDEARRGFARAGALGLSDGWRNLGRLEDRERNTQASIEAYNQALVLFPRDAVAHAALSLLHERRHEITTARRHAERALNSDPNNVLARIVLARTLIRQKEYPAAEAAVGPVAQGANSETNRALAWSLIGDARDHMENYSAAFEAWTTANKIQLQQHAALFSASDHLYHPDSVRHMTELIDATDISAWSAPAAYATPAPVFLVGFPRSGTTLLDQVLSSHAQLHCIEERPHFANALASILTDPAKLARYAQMSEADIEGARRAYWNNVRSEAPIPANAHIIDKLPLNIVVLPLIKRVFPDAKIIFALRDPRDAILSCYQQQFGMNAAMAQFLELDRAATYYDLVMRLFVRCQQKLALDLHLVRYESVVANIEQEARSLADFLGVAYDPAMLQFDETARRREIDTPSARQVTEPLHNRSIGRWRRYEAQLALALPYLNPWAATLGYEAPQAH